MLRARLTRLGVALDRSLLRRHMLFAALTAVAVAVLGYHYGTFDQSVHVPFLKARVDPSLYPGDPFLELQGQHYSYFWLAFDPLWERGWLEPALFGLHVLVTYLTFLALWGLARTLFDRPEGALLGVVALAVPHTGFAGFTVLEFSLLNRTFVLPFLLLALTLYLRRRVLVAFLLLGALYNLHVISVNFALAMLLLDAVRRRREVGTQTLVGGLALFALAASPVLLWRLGDGGLGLEVDRLWFDTISRGMLHNVFHLFDRLPHILLFTASGLATIALYVIARRAGPPRPHDRTVDHFMLAAAGLVALQAIVARTWPITLVIELQIARAGVFVLLFGYLYFADHLARRLTTADSPADRPWWTVLAALVLAPLPLAPLGAWAAARARWSARVRQAAAVAALVLIGGGGLALAVHRGAWAPAIHIAGPQTPWVDVQRWAQQETPRAARFVTPPQRWWWYEPDWRVFSERPTVATLSELLELAYAREHVRAWRPRFEAVAPGALARFRGDYFENRALVAAAYAALSDADVRRVAKRYDAHYMVDERPSTRAFPVVYENDAFVVYDLRGRRP